MRALLQKINAKLPKCVVISYVAYSVNLDTTTTIFIEFFSRQKRHLILVGKDVGVFWSDFKCGSAREGVCPAGCAKHESDDLHNDWNETFFSHETVYCLTVALFRLKGSNSIWKNICT